MNTTDVFATALDLAGADVTAIDAAEALDAVSMRPYLEDPDSGPQRRYIFSELFSPNGIWHTVDMRMIRDSRYKLLREGTHKPYEWQFYDLELDPFETNDLSDQVLSPDAQNHRRRLRRELKPLPTDQPGCIIISLAVPLTPR